VVSDGWWLIEICPYCGEQITEPPNKLLRGHTHQGVPELHGHSESVYIPRQVVEVVRRRRFDDLVSACKEWRSTVEADQLAEAFPSKADQALFEAIDKAEGKQ
jgi:hypothetical protein